MTDLPIWIIEPEQTDKRELAALRLSRGGQKAAHNIFLQNAAELGLLGHPLWLAIIFGTMFSLYRFMRRARQFPAEMRWAYYWSRGLLLGMAAFCIHGMFHNEEYLELMFVIVGMNVCLQTATRRELRQHGLLSAAQEAQATAAPAGRTPRRKPASTHPGLMFERPVRTRRAAAVRGLA